MHTTFSLSQMVVYPTHGVGKITDIQTREFNGRDTLYYTIYIEVSDMTIMIPVDNAEDRGIRAIVSPEEAWEALAILESELQDVPSDWKIRYEVNRQHLLKGGILNIATVVQTLYHRSKIKELPIMERKLYDSAHKLLVDELSISLLKSNSEVEELISDRLRSNISLRGTEDSVLKNFK